MRNTYALIPVGVIIILAYSLSFILSRLNIIARVNHRRFWNVLLLIAFSVCGLLGMLMVLKINYKWTIPGYNTIMHLHVDFGIAMFFILLFHLSWHVKYYLNLFKHRKEKNEDQQIPPSEIDDHKGMKGRSLYLALFLLGFITISFQIVVLRELVAVFNGNELVLGVVLFNWMLLTATGAYLGKYFPPPHRLYSFISRAFMILSILPLVLTVLLYLLKNQIFIPGTETGLWQVCWSSFILLLPFCLLSGMLFPVLSHSLSSRVGSNQTGKGYAMESFGSIAGGGIVSFILVFFLDSFQILLFLFLCANLLGIAILLKNDGRITWIIRVILALVAIYAMIYADIGYYVRQKLYINQELIFSGDSPHGNIAITSQAGQINFYQNHVLIANSNDIVENEEAVHYGMLQHASPHRVLMVSGWFPGQVKEVLKYHPAKIDFVDMDKSMLTFKKQLTGVSERDSVSFINTDPRVFIRENPDSYDVILINLPVPSSAQLNRFFTGEFFHSVKYCLRDSGVVSIAFTSSMNYMDEDMRIMNSSIVNALRPVFKNVHAISGQRNYLLASDAPLTEGICSKVEDISLDNEYVGSFYLDDMLIQQRSLAFMSSIDTSVSMNRDFYPIVYGSQFRLWLARSGINYKPILLVILLLVIVLAFTLHPVYLGMFTGGFAAASYEVILIIAFQIVYGYMYLATGIIITLFMAGMGVGALLRRNRKDFSVMQYILVQIALGISGVFLPLVMQFTNNHPASLALQMIYYIIAFLISVLVGMVFALSSRLPGKNYLSGAANVYSVDLLGSALGALLVSAFLIPGLGVFYVSFLIGGMCLLSAVNLWVRGRRIMKSY